MKRLIAFCRRRLKSSKGETIAEVLVSLLIAALALTMLAAMVASAVRMTDDSRNNIDEYYLAGGRLASLSDAADGSGEAVLTGDSGTDVWTVDYYTDGKGSVGYRKH